MADIPSTRPRQYLIAPRSIPGLLQPMSADDLQGHIERMPNAKVVKKIKSKGLSTFGVGGEGGLMPDTMVVEMDYNSGMRLQSTAPPNVIVEPNERLSYVDFTDPFDFAKTAAVATLRPLSNFSTVLRFKVLGEDDRPLANASVAVYGDGFPAQGVTDSSGDAAVQVFGGGADSVRAIYIKPFANHWERFVTRPQLNDSGVNIVKLVPFSQSLPGFPNADAMGWGARVMRLDQFPNMTGRGVKIAIVDSGCDKSHPQLRHVSNGLDLTGGGTPDGWAQDTIAHGTHCAGVITGRRLTPAGGGIRGFAPEAEVHAFKVFPGGRLDSLIEALDECIIRRIDIVNLSLGSGQGSELVTRKLIEARQNGVACIVAAGNSGGAVQFPGSAPGVLTVSAVGKLKEFPDDTNHAQTMLAAPQPNGIFSAKFTCFGSQVAVCGPGVAVLSTVPGGGYAAWDGTSMATPHVTGLAALVLAHHPALEPARQRRDEQRVEQLFQVIRSGCVPQIADPLRGGSGLPMLDRLFVAAAQTGAQAPQNGRDIGNFAQFAPIQAPGGGLGGPQALQQIIVAAQLGHPGALQALWQLRGAGFAI